MSNHHKPTVKSDWIVSFFLADHEISSNQWLVDFYSEKMEKEPFRGRKEMLHKMVNSQHWDLKKLINRKYPTLLNG